MKGIFLGILCLLSCFSLSAQKKQKVSVETFTPTAIDGNIAEWKNLTPVDKGIWFYSLTQDTENLYLAVGISLRKLQQAAARNGIYFIVVSKDKKKDNIFFLSPFIDRETNRALLNEDRDTSADIRAELVARARGYFVLGFPTIPDGMLSFQNNYGLKAEILVEGKDFLYEAVIPKKLLQIKQSPVQLKIGINTGNEAFLIDKDLPDKLRASKAERAGGSLRQIPPGKKSKVVTEVWLEASI